MARKEIEERSGEVWAVVIPVEGDDATSVGSGPLRMPSNGVFHSLKWPATWPKRTPDNADCKNPELILALTLNWVVEHFDVTETLLVAKDDDVASHLEAVFGEIKCAWCRRMVRLRKGVTLGLLK